jgi:3-oxoadipate enol-lactonase
MPIVRTTPASGGFPAGHDVDLTGRGTTFVREVPGPANAPVLIALHGWTASADLNWYPCYSAFGEHFRVLAPDLRGHSRGLRTRSRFRLEDCADDVVALADDFDIESFYVVGYSMGGTVAQLLARRHPQRVRGMVLAATAGYFAASNIERRNFLGMAVLARISRLVGSQMRTWVTERAFLQKRTAEMAEWAVRQMGRHDWRMILEAGSAIGDFDSRQWVSSLQVATAVLVTTDDLVVPPSRQEELVTSVRAAHVARLAAGHDAVWSRREECARLLVELALDVHRSRSITP